MSIVWIPTYKARIKCTSQQPRNRKFPEVSAFKCQKIEVCGILALVESEARNPYKMASAYMAVHVS